MPPPYRIALLHGAGYAGGELIRLLAGHSGVVLEAVTSRSQAGKPVWTVHPHLRGLTDLAFIEPSALDASSIDAVLLAAEHGQAAQSVVALLEAGFAGKIVDLSADFRFKQAEQYPRWFGHTHPAPELLDAFVYGLPEAYAPYPAEQRFIANPGCFATGITLALLPLARHLDAVDATVTALTGASGSGTRPKPTTHFPTREGNVKSYKVLQHQHVPEVEQTLGAHARVHLIPVSGPWTRGIWGTVQITLPDGVTEDDVRGWYESAYEDAPFVRLWPDLPELRFAANTPYCDLGWLVHEDRLVVGFALDNLLKGAASQAIQNLNLLLGLPETAGLLPVRQEAVVPAVD